MFFKPCVCWGTCFPGLDDGVISQSVLPGFSELDTTPDGYTVVRLPFEPHRRCTVGRQAGPPAEPVWEYTASSSGTPSLHPDHPSTTVTPHNSYQLHFVKQHTPHKRATTVTNWTHTSKTASKHKHALAWTGRRVWTCEHVSHVKCIQSDPKSSESPLQSTAHSFRSPVEVVMFCGFPFCCCVLHFTTIPNDHDK